MTDRANNPLVDLPAPPVISPASRLAIAIDFQADGASSTANTGTNPFAANDLLAYPIFLPAKTKVNKFWWMNGSAAGGNWAGAIYDADFVKLIQTASTAGSGSSAPQVVSMPCILPPGMYYLALAHDGTTSNRIWRWSVSTTTLRTAGCWRQASVTLATLPSPATPAAYTASLLPLFGVTTRTVFDL